MAAGWGFARLLVITFLISSCNLATLSPEPTTLTATPSVGTTSQPSTVSTISAVVAFSFVLPPTPLGPLALAVDARAGWATVGGEASGTLYQIDPTSGHVIRTQAVGWAPEWMADAGTILWVVDTVGDGSQPDNPKENAVEMIRASDGKLLRTIPVVNPGQVVGSSTVAWVLERGTEIVRIPGAGLETTTNLSSYGQTTAMVVVGDDLQVSMVHPGVTGSTLVMISPNGVVRGMTSVPETIAGIIPVKDRAWVLAQLPSGTWEVAYLDTGRLVSVGTVPGAVNASTFTTDGRRAFVALTDGSIFDLDLGTGHLVRLDLPSDSDPATALVAAPDGVWTLTSTRVIKFVLK
jgi:hypothetical protein